MYRSGERRKKQEKNKNKATAEKSGGICTTSTFPPLQSGQISVKSETESVEL